MAAIFIDLDVLRCYNGIQLYLVVNFGISYSDLSQHKVLRVSVHQKTLFYEYRNPHYIPRTVWWPS